MTRAVAVLRPEPGNAATAQALEAAGLAAIRLPLFAVAALPWTPPDPVAFDALLLTSANAVRHAGAGLARLSALPVAAVGVATAQAARAAGLRVQVVGDRDAIAAKAAAGAAGLARLLHLAGRDHHRVAGATTIAVYASEPATPDPVRIRALAGTVVLIHSARAGAALAAAADAAGLARGRVRIAAISAPALAAAGTGWRAAVAASMPNEAALVWLARHLATESGGD